VQYVHTRSVNTKAESCCSYVVCHKNAMDSAAVTTSVFVKIMPATHQSKNFPSTVFVEFRN